MIITQSHMETRPSSVNPCFGIITLPTTATVGTSTLPRSREPLTPLSTSSIRKIERTFSPLTSSSLRDTVRETRSGVILIDNTGNVLCVKQATPTQGRRTALQHHKCNWGFPKGRVCRQDFGNDARDITIAPPEEVMINCALRELHEETGVTLQPHNLVLRPRTSASSRIHRTSHWRYLTIDTKSDKMFVAIVSARPQVRVDNVEISKHAWMKLRELSCKQHSTFTANIIKNLLTAKTKHPSIARPLNQPNEKDGHSTTS